MYGCTCTVHTYTGRMACGPVGIAPFHELIVRFHTSILFILSCLFPIPHACDTRVALLFLELEYAIHQRFARGRTTRHVDINRHDAIAAPCNAIAVMVISATVGAAAHANHPSWLGHLVVDLP